MSLVQILIGAALGGLVMYYSGRFLLQMNKSVASSMKSKNRSTSLGIISGNLQKYMGTGDVLFFAFSGNAATENKSLVRFLVPQFGLCSDLDTANTQCPSSASFVYAHYDKTTSPSISLICPLSDTVWLADLSRETYGTATATASGFNVNAPVGFASGPVAVTQNKVLALMNAPYATLWIATNTHSKFDTTQVTNGPAEPTLTPDLPPECRINLQRITQNPLEYDVSKLYQINVVPYRIAQFTGSTTSVTSAEIQTARAGFPTRFFQATLRSLGIEPQADGTKHFAIKNCDYDSGSNKLNCTGPSVAWVPEAKQMRLESFYRVRFKQGANIADSYDLATVGTPTYNGCDSSRCKRLSFDPSAIPGVLGDESTDNLDSSNFSLIKQESLGKLRFHVIFDKKLEKFDVIF